MDQQKHMSQKNIIQAVKMIGSRAKIEASGEMTLRRVRDIAKLGVDYISIGALTHSVKSISISQEMMVAKTRKSKKNNVESTANVECE